MYQTHVLCIRCIRHTRMSRQYTHQYTHQYTQPIQTRVSEKPIETGEHWEKEEIHRCHIVRRLSLLHLTCFRFHMFRLFHETVQNVLLEPFFSVNRCDFFPSGNLNRKLKKQQQTKFAYLAERNLVCRPVFKIGTGINIGVKRFFKICWMKEGERRSSILFNTFRKKFKAGSAKKFSERSLLDYSTWFFSTPPPSNALKVRVFIIDEKTYRYRHTIIRV